MGKRYDETPFVRVIAPNVHPIYVNLYDVTFIEEGEVNGRKIFDLHLENENGYLYGVYQVEPRDNDKIEKFLRGY